jgi:hypothetical protein
LDQDGEVIDATGIFDFGNYDAGVCGDPTEDRWTSVGLCGSPTLGNGILFSKTGDTFNNGDEFRVTMTVRVGATADPLEAIFSNNAVANYWTTSNEQGNCSCSATSVVAQATGVGFAWSGVADQTEIQADFLITPTEDGFGAILFDLPQIDVDVENVAAGQRVYLDVTIEKLPCGIVKSETICLAELIADCPAAAGAVTIDGIAFIGDRQLTNVLHGYLGRMGNIVPTTNLTFPYVPAINDPGFFTGLVINNTSTSDADLMITVTDNAGGSASYSTSLNAGLQWVNTLDSIEGSLVDGATPLNKELSGYVNVAATVAP